MIIVISITAIYLLSTLGAYKYMQKAHYHKKGRWSSTKPENTDIITTLTPILNIFPAIGYLMGGWKKDEYKETNFFKPRK